MSERKLVLILALGLAAVLLNAKLRQMNKIEEQLVVTDVERFLRFSRLQGLIKQEDNAAVSAIESRWRNADYKEHP